MARKVEPITGKAIDELGGSCIIDLDVRGRRGTDYDGYNDYNSVTIEKEGNYGHQR